MALNRAIFLIEFLVFGDDLFPLQAGQALQPHVQDGLGLELGEFEFAPSACVLASSRVGGCADQLDHVVQDVEGLLETLQDVGPLLGLAQIIDGPPDDDLAAVSRNCSRISLRFRISGRPLTMASRMMPKEISIWVYL